MVFLQFWFTDSAANDRTSEVLRLYPPVYVLFIVLIQVALTSNMYIQSE